MLSPTQLDQLQQHYPILAALDPALCLRALQHAKVVALPAGTPLFHEAQACQAFPFILEGAVRVFKASSSGRELPLYRVEPGDACVVSSGCLLSGRSYNASGVVQQDCQLVLMPEPDFELLMADRPFRQYMFGLFSERLAELMQLIEAVAFHKLDQRLAAVLLGKGPQLQCSHQQLADELGSVREMVSRLLKSFADDGLVRLGREQIAILDAPRLRRIASAM